MTGSPKSATSCFNAVLLSRTYNKRPNGAVCKVTKGTPGPRHSRTKNLLSELNVTLLYKHGESLNSIRLEIVTLEALGDALVTFTVTSMVCIEPSSAPEGGGEGERLVSCDPFDVTSSTNSSLKNCGPVWYFLTTLDTEEFAMQLMHKGADITVEFEDFSDALYKWRWPGAPCGAAIKYL